MANRKKILHYSTKPKNPIATAIVFVALLYILVRIFVFMSKEPASIYEVTYGSTAEMNQYTYTGIVLRDETCYTAPLSGHLNFYVREGARVSKNTTLYSIDEKGTISSMLQSLSEDEKTLTKEDLSNIKKDLSLFASRFDSNDFSKVYDFKYSLQGALMEAVSANMLNQIYDSVSKDSFSISSSPQTGLVYYSLDGYEAYKEPSQVNRSLFDEKNRKEPQAAKDLVAAGENIFKIVSGEQWQIVIPLDKQSYDFFLDKDNKEIEIELKKDNRNVYGRLQLLTLDDGYYGVIHLNKYLMNYVSDRFLTLQIHVGSVNGLKIPVSSVFDQEFFLLPTSYVTKGGNDNDESGFNLERITADGGTSIEFITPTIYFNTDEYCYISMLDVKAGDVLVKVDTNERYQVSQKGILKGVYQINSGYALFKLVDILSGTSEYYIINDKTENGLVIYDHILLKKGDFSEGDLIY